MSRLTQQQQSDIRQVFKETGSIRHTARRTGISRNAVRRELRRLSLPNAPASYKRASKLDAYKAKIGYLVGEKHLTAVRVLEEINALGYQGGYSILKDYIRTIRPKPFRRPTPPIDHPPGEEGQMDWSPHATIIGGQRQIVHTGSIVLCFSRWLFIRHFPDETIERVIGLHEEAFEELDAVPHTMTYDNMTTVGRHTGPAEVWINPTFKRFADQYGFKIIILPPGAKERHGKVERPFHYIEHNFLAGREFENMEDINRRADLWRANTANVRIHGTLRERPVDRLIRERPYLKALPRSLSDVFFKEVDRLIHTDFCVAVDTNRYSTDPNLIGQDAKVRLYKDHLEIWVNQQLDCKHTYVQDRFKRQVLPEHEQIYKKITGQRQLLKNAFLRLGQPAVTYYEGLKKQRGAAAGYHLQRILQYAERHGHDVVAGALAHAARYGAYSADAVLRIIQGKKLKQGSRIATEVVPENIRQWLRACAVEKQDPDLYDKMVQKNNKDPEEDE
jgi:transposase